ncbi:tRNA (adenosine(37)-N6)-threonylcarbamoyltransferase complex ATPase subunit type 1 TsaE [Candidatus Peregrinibacteria bacterium]|nr:tRNA (adenosine(37)-N6)-threonylcarbamoyltransferase complex ATPase subunit type 1 TsaE [Candidatus Peregrinibacteria bacterium]
MLYKARNLEELDQVAKLISSKFKKPAIVFLKGNLGVGKTAFVKSFCKNHQISERTVKSPTFSLINIYKKDHIQINHLDLYRLTKSDLYIEEELKEIALKPNAISFIEWGERMDNVEKFKNVANLYKITITNNQDNIRNITFQEL